MAVCFGVKAQEVYVTDLNDLDSEKTYLIESQRCVLINSANVTTGLATTNGTSVGTVKRDFTDNNQLFKIEKDGENYYLYSVGASKYVTDGGAWSDTKGTALKISNVSSENAGYPWKLSLGSNYLNSQDPNQTATGIVINSWSSTDPGNCYRFVDVAVSTPEVIDYPNELSEFDQNKCYTVTTKVRGGWAVDANGRFVSTREAGTVADEYKQFAVLSADGENYYLYNVGAKAFITTDGADAKKGTTVNGLGEAITLIDASAEGDCRVLVQFKGNSNGYINLNGESNMDVCGWNAIDHGNAVAFIEAGDFNPAEALAMLSNVATVTYKFMYEGVEVAKQETTVDKGNSYPAFNVSNVPLGVILAEEVPTGTVTADVTVEIDLAIDNSLIPFEFAAEGTPTVWYYAQIHVNNKSYIKINENDKLYWKEGGVGTGAFITAIAAEDVDDYSWGFVGSVFGGFKMINKDGRGVKMADDGTVTTVAASDATAFLAMPVAVEHAGAFGLYAQNANGYLNAQATIASWWDKDAGSAIVLTERNDNEISVSELGYATLYLGEPVFIPADVEAYVVSSVDGEYAQMTQVTGILPANTGVILKNAGEYTFTTSSAANAIENNLLYGTVEAKAIEKDPAYNYYILANGENGVGLYNPTVSGDATKFNNAANKAYLMVPATDSAANVASYSFRFGEGTTGISEVKGENGNVKAIYDLTGRKVETISAPGIYIVGGKKVLVR